MRSPFYINRNPLPRGYRLLFGLAEVFGGLVVLLSLGTVGCNLTVDVARVSTKRHFRKLREQAAKSSTVVEKT